MEKVKGVRSRRAVPAGREPLTAGQKTQRIFRGAGVGTGESEIAEKWKVQ